MIGICMFMCVLGNESDDGKCIPKEASGCSISVSNPVASGAIGCCMGNTKVCSDFGGLK